MSVENLFNNSELAQAAYANLSVGNTNFISNLATLKDSDDGAGMSQKQAEEFAARYTKVITVINDSSVTGFSATVFESSSSSGNQLTLAIRGTDEFIGTDGDDDIDIFVNGIAREQIVAMVNWWSKVTSINGQSVQQFGIQSYLEGVDTVPVGAVFLYKTEGNGPVPIDTGYYLVQTADAIATGELYGRADQKLSITGHSLGGHLAMAFGAIFAADTESVMAFNVPGFDNNAINQNIFNALGGSVPVGQLTTNVISNKSDIC